MITEPMHLVLAQWARELAAKEARLATYTKKEWMREYLL